MHSVRDEVHPCNFVNHFAMSQDSKKIFFGNLNGTLKVMDVESTFLTEMIIYAYSGVIRWLGVSPCGNLLASLGYQSANLMEELRFWHLEGDGL